MYERLHKLYQACLISPCTPACMWFLALLQAHWRLSSHQDVPAGPRLGRVPGLSAACVLAECCQIIPHSWKVAWRRSYPCFTEKAQHPHPALLQHRLDPRGKRWPLKSFALTSAQYMSSAVFVQHVPVSACSHHCLMRRTAKNPQKNPPTKTG